MISKLSIISVLALLVLVPLSYAQGMEVVFEGRVYSSVDAVIAAHFKPDSIGLTPDDPILHCTPKTTKQILQRGYYDMSEDMMHCFRTEADLSVLGAQNYAMETAYRGQNAGSTNQELSASGRCAGENRGTPFRYNLYSGAYPDVCVSHPYEERTAPSYSYWQVGDGATGFKVRGLWGKYFYTYLTQSSGWGGPQRYLL